MSQTSYAITTKTFNSLQEMKNSTELSIGMVCETLGYYVKGDGGGARYTIEEKGTETANDMDIIAIGNDYIARYLYEGKPVNVLQFGAINTYTTGNQGYIPYEEKEHYTRDDQPMIQRAIDYTHEKLNSYEERDVLNLSQKCYKNAINTVIIPEGNYIIKTQITMPPYMQFYLTGDVQFLSVIKSFASTVYKLDKTTSPYKFVKITDVESSPKGIADEVPSKEEIFAKNDFYDGSTKMTFSTFENEYYVYKHATLKICYKFDDNGNPINPFKIGSHDRYAAFPTIYKDIFIGNGTLTFNNLVRTIEGTFPYYTCAVEIGSTVENLRYLFANKAKSKILPYEYLRISNLKIRNYHIGILQHGHSFYGNVISNVDFYHNDIGFQFGIYGEKEALGTDYIIGEEGVDCGEMNHFRDCLFTGNKISVNIMLSGLSASFTSCHFDFDNCVFRAAYRTCLIVDKCHIEGIGKDLRQEFLASDEEMQNRLFVMTREKLNDFNNRASSDPLNEFAGIMYAKPVTKFGGNQSEQRSYVQLSIINSRIIDNEYLPCGMFSYYNQGKAETCDGHYRSNLYLNNNTYGIGSVYPISYLTSKTDGIVQSGFLLSEFPEKELGASVIGTEKDAVQNIPVMSCNSKEYGSYNMASKPRGNHRFLSNRTLANKYPYFQNVDMVDSGSAFSGANVYGENLPERFVVAVNISVDKSRPKHAFMHYGYGMRAIQLFGPVIDGAQSTINNEQPKICFDLIDDIISCKKDDVIAAALVTDHIPYNDKITVSEDGTNIESKDAVVHSIMFTEFDSEGTILGKYEYDIPYNCSYSDDNQYDVANYPSTGACKHIVNNKTADRIMTTIKASLPVKYGDEAVDTPYGFNLHAILVDKNR